MTNYEKFSWCHRRSVLAKDVYIKSFWYYTAQLYLCRHLGEPDDFYERLVRWKRNGMKGIPTYENSIGK